MWKSCETYKSYIFKKSPAVASNPLQSLSFIVAAAEVMAGCPLSERHPVLRYI